MSGTSSHRCNCHNVAHGHGLSCSQPTAGSSELCETCSDAAKMAGVLPTIPNLVSDNVTMYPMSNAVPSLIASWNYPLSNVSSAMYNSGVFVEGVPAGLFYRDQEKVRSLQDEIRRLEDNLTKTATALQKEKDTAAGHKEREAKLSSALSELETNQQLAFLLDRVSPEAANVLLDSEALRKEFLGDEARPLFAMSVDIRRSTDLMLKARTPQAFALFITKLCRDLMDVVLSHNGVVDKFTGDGILCFFPEFFSGKDAGYYALAAASACHATFAKHYQAHRNSFTSVLKDVGLGIGVDYGDCHLVQVAGSLTIVGSPVVYACRLGGAPAGITLLNQPAYEVISERHGGHVLLEETSIEIKHEGDLVAYSATLARATFVPSPPAWKDAREFVAGKNAASPESHH
jgi:class 3 adenylate cyclase